MFDKELYHISNFVENDQEMVKIVYYNFKSGRKGAMNLKSEDSAYSLDSGDQKNLTL